MRDDTFVKITFFVMLIIIIGGLVLVARYNHERILIGENGECTKITVEEPENKDKTTQWMLASDKICGSAGIKAFNIEQVNGYSQPKVECK
ncbi:MAG: hypothetical protein KCHDKBKB_00641 [Elusimicrobia bacterium]|nr:hypothetical protein [Elusimicrobiota bacterium]